MISKTFYFQDSKISYKVLGKGYPVVLLHGFGFSNKIWFGIAESLKNDFMFIMPDLPGSGGSEKLYKQNVSLTDYTEVINELIEIENLISPVIIGHSMGGYITMAFEKKYPDLSVAICLFHSSGYSDDSEKISSRKKSIEFIKKYGSETFMNNNISGLFYNKEKSANDIFKYTEDAKKIAPEVIIQYYEAMISRDDNSDVLKKINKPVMFIVGESDTAIPFKLSLQQAYIPNISEIVILRNSSHMGMLEEESKSSKTLYKFLNDVLLNKVS